MGSSMKLYTQITCVSRVRTLDYGVVKCIKDLVPYQARCNPNMPRTAMVLPRYWGQHTSLELKRNWSNLNINSFSLPIAISKPLDSLLFTPLHQDCLNISDTDCLHCEPNPRILCTVNQQWATTFALHIHRIASLWTKLGFQEARLEMA